MADIIDKLLEMSDEELMKKSGLDDRFTRLKEQLGEAAKLSGEARKCVADEIDEMLAPRLSENSLEWRIKDAKREEERKKVLEQKSGASVMEESDPATMVEDME